MICRKMYFYFYNKFGRLNHSGKDLDVGRTQDWEEADFIIHLSSPKFRNRGINITYR